MKKLKALLLISILCFGVVCANDEPLKTSWEFYKKTFISDDGRVIDFDQNHISTSEGQAYALLRAIMINDRKTFDNAYKWANVNLKRKDNNLYSWLWGKKNDGSWGVIDVNTASDANIDTAFALIIASNKWNDKKYLDDALKIINDIWNYETIVVKGERILLSGIEQGKYKYIEMNPSYFAPYAFRVFAKYDKNHNWNELVDTSYKLAIKSSYLTETKLPPDWFMLNSETGDVFLDPKNPSKADFSYDAIRTFIRFYIDYVVYKDKRAEEILWKVNFFVDRYNKFKDGTFYTNFRQNGEVRDSYESIGNTALLIPVIKLYDHKLAEKLYKDKIEKNYNKNGYWQDPRNYYQQNLVWLGTWVYLNDDIARKFNKQ